MKILQINASYKPAYVYGGPALSVSRLCEGLIRAGADLEVLTTTANGPDELPVEKNKQVKVDGVKVTYFKRLTKDHTHFSPALLTEVRRKIKHFGIRKSDIGNRVTPLIIHIHAWWNLVSVFSCLIARLYKVPVILTPRGTLSNYSFGNRNVGIKGLIHLFLGKALLESCHFHVTSEKEKEDILSLVKPKSIRVIPNFVYLPQIRGHSSKVEYQKSQEETHYTQERNVTKLLFLSRIEEKKGLEIFFNALSQINTPFHLDIAGSGEETYILSLKRLASQLNILGKISWLGQKTQVEKWKVLEEHDILVLTSYDENFANVVIECLAMGTPVLVSNKVGLADYVERKRFGWVCRPEADSAKETLELAFKDYDTIQNTRTNAPSRIRQDFDEDTLVKEFLDLYTEVIELNNNLHF